MGVKKTIISKVSENAILRNAILAVCAVIVFMSLVAILLNVFTRHNESEQIPDFSNMSMEDARRAARRGSLKLEISDSIFVPALDGGVILDQLPKPGTHVKSGRRVFLTVNAYDQRVVEIPYVTGYSLRQAKNILEVAGLEIDRLVYRPDMATNNVLEEQFNGKVVTDSNDLEAEQGSGITLIVGMKAEDPLPTTPKLVGFPLKEAKSRIWEAGLNVGKIEFDEELTILDRNEAKVYSQSPEQGTRTVFGSQVTIRLTDDRQKVDKGSTASDKAAEIIISSQRAEDKREAEEQLD